MTKGTDKPRYIIVLGTTYSGSGAVFDYFAGRRDVHDPLGGKEYQLPQSPHGLMALEAASGSAFHPGAADFSLNRFEEVVRKLARPRTRLRYGNDYARKLPEFLGAVDDFIADVALAHLPMRLVWHRLMQTPGQRALTQLKARLGIDEPPQTTRLLAQPDALVAAACTMHDNIFRNGAEGRRPVLLNQAGSGWNPIESTKYFSDRRIIVVERDPRDQFVELKQNKKASFAEGFVDWYIQMQRRLSQVDSRCLMRVRFETFVCSQERMVPNVCEHTGISDCVQSTYQPELSRKNVGKHRYLLAKSDARIIERELSDYFAIE